MGQLPSWVRIGPPDVDDDEEPGPIRRRVRWLAARWYFGFYPALAALQVKLGLDSVSRGGLWSLVYLGLAVLMVALVFVMERLRRNKERRQATAKAIALTDVVKDTEKKAAWCIDCGTRVVVFRYQNGFKLVTGEPAYRRVLGCPQWDGDMSRELNPMVMAFATRALTEREVYTCGNRVTTDPEIELKHNHDESNVSLDCELCLINMESARVMSKTEVTERIAALHR